MMRVIYILSRGKGCPQVCLPLAIQTDWTLPASASDIATVLVDAFDTQIKYLNVSGEWITSGAQVETSVQGASMIFDFIGALPGSLKYFV